MQTLVRRGLTEQGHVVDVAGTGPEAVERAGVTEFDVLVVDLMLPGYDGVEAVRRLRAAGNRTPALMLTARDGATDIVTALDAGADDYLVKPFSFAVLLARLRALGRRGPAAQGVQLRVADLLLDSASREVTRAGVRIHLTPTEHNLLEALMRRGAGGDATRAGGRRVGRRSRRREQHARRVREVAPPQGGRQRRRTADPHDSRCRLLDSRGAGAVRRGSIRSRLVIWYLAVLAAAIAVLAVGAWALLRRSVNEAADDTLRARVDGVKRFIDAVEKELPREEVADEFQEYATLTPGDSLLEVVDPAGTVLVKPAVNGWSDLTAGITPADAAPVAVDRALQGRPFRVLAGIAHAGGTRLPRDRGPADVGRA